MTGAELREWRIKQGYTQTELAHRVGVSLPTISVWERHHAERDLQSVALCNNWRALQRAIKVGI